MAAKKKTVTSKKKVVVIEPIENSVKALLKAYAKGTLNKKKHPVKISSLDNEARVEVLTGAKDKDGKILENEEGTPEVENVFVMDLTDFEDECCVALGIVVEKVD